MKDLLNSAVCLASASTAEDALTLLQTHTAQHVPHHAGAVRLRDGTQRGWPDATFPVEPLVLPQRLDEANGTPFASIWPDVTSVLAVALEEGMIVLGSRDRAAFTSEHADTLTLLALATDSALRAHRLREAQAQVLQSSKLAGVGQLAAGVTHEMNSPLGTLLIGIQAAQIALPDNPERALRKLEMAEKAALQARSIVRKMLFYAREARTGLREFSLNDVVNDTVELLAHQLSIDGVTLDRDLQDPMPLLTGKQSEIQQVVTNLLLNARDAVLAPSSPDRRITVQTRVGKSTLRLSVSDEGDGVSADVKASLFQPFVTTKPDGAGTGLGLSISRQIVEQHGGTLTLEHAQGPTTFLVTLPLES